MPSPSSILILDGPPRATALANVLTSGKGDFCAEPRPPIAMRALGWHRHPGTVAFEKYWLRRWF